MAVRLDEIFRVWPAREERIELTGHWHALSATLIQGAAEREILRTYFYNFYRIAPCNGPCFISRSRINNNNLQISNRLLRNSVQKSTDVVFFVITSNNY